MLSNCDSYMKFSCQGSHRINTNICPRQQSGQIWHQVGLEANVGHHHSLEPNSTLQESAGICRNLQDASSCVASNAKFDRKYMKMPNMPNDPNAVQVTHARIFSESLVGTKSPAAYLTARTGWILHQHRRLGDHYISLWHNMNIIDMLKYVENISKHVLWFQVIPMLFTLPSLKRALLWRCPQPKRGKLRILGTVRHWELTILTEPYWTILNDGSFQLCLPTYPSFMGSWPWQGPRIEQHATRFVHVYYTCSIMQLHA